MNFLIAPRASVGLGRCGTCDRLHDPVLTAVILDIAQAIGRDLRIGSGINLTTILPAHVGSLPCHLEQAQARILCALQCVVVQHHTTDPAIFGKGAGLRLDLLRRKDP